MIGTVLGRADHATAQVRDTVPAITKGDLVSSSVALVLLVTPRATGWGTGLPGCAPCDRADVPGFDRWAIHEPRSGWALASNVGLLAVTGLATADLALRRDPRHLVATMEAGLWTAGLTEVIKAAVGRSRPILYTTEAPTVADQTNSVRSFPSGHTSIAFAFATAYWLSRKDLYGKPGALGWTALAVATGVGVSRVAAGKHFPSDVVAGAALGAANAIVVYKLKL